MCELLGLSFNKPVDIKISFTGFRERGRIHRDGWGIASYSAGKASIVKEPAEAYLSPNSKEITRDAYYLSDIYIGHVRMMSRGERLMENTHPFKISFNGKDHVFAHNGTLTGYRSMLPLGSFVPAGSTDSEHAFCYLMNGIKMQEPDWTDQDSFHELLKIIRTINQTGKFNCLFSDGQKLFAYLDVNGYNGLQLTRRQRPFHRTRLIDTDWELNLDRMKDPSENGYVIATKPLTDERWERMKNGELIVFEKGKMIWSNARDVNHQ